jgi:hypothetical protein
MVRRAVALGAGVVVLILLFLSIRACQTSAKKNSLRDYNTEVSAIGTDSDTQVAKPFFQLLSSAGRSSPVNVESQVSQYRAVAEDEAKRARDLDAPGQMTGAQRSLLTALDFRAEALGTIADKIRAALGTGSGAQTAVNQIAGQMEKLLASDVLWSQRVAPLIKEALDDNDVTGQSVRVSRFVGDLAWLDPGAVADRLGAQGASTTGGAVAPGAHGHGLVSVAVGPTTLQPGNVNRIPATTPPTFTVRFQNQGDNDERNVKVSLRVSGAGRPIAVNHIEPKTTSGQTAAAELTLPRRPPVGTPVTITVAVAPVRGEKTTDNNRQEYPALFTR